MGQIKMLLEKGFCYRRSRWSGSPLYHCYYRFASPTNWNTMQKSPPHRISTCFFQDLGANHDLITSMNTLLRPNFTELRLHSRLPITIWLNFTVVFHPELYILRFPQGGKWRRSTVTRSRTSANTFWTNSRVPTSTFSSPPTLPLEESTLKT